MAAVTDSAVPTANSASQAFTLQVNKANTTTSVMSNANPSVFQQTVTFTVTVAPQYSCTPTGMVTLVRRGNADRFHVADQRNGNIPDIHSVGHHCTRSPPATAGDSNFNASNDNSTPWSQTVNKAPTQVSFNSVSPSPVFVGQPVTISYTFSVVVAGTGSPVTPSGSITVTATDNANPVPHNSSCVASPTLGGGMCQLSPAPPAAGSGIVRNHIHW